MNEYISKQEFIHLLEEEGKDIRQDINEFECEWGYSQYTIDSALEQVSSIVIPNSEKGCYCKDCKHASPFEYNMGDDWIVPTGLYYCNYCQAEKEPNGFCDEGERKN